MFTSVVPHTLELTFDCRNDDYATPLDLLDEDSEEMFDLLDKDHLLPRSSDPNLGEHIIEVSMCVESPLLSETILHFFLYSMQTKSGVGRNSLPPSSHSSCFLHIFLLLYAWKWLLNHFS